jgi:UDP-N-acetylglucosamine 2-epimerase
LNTAVVIGTRPEIIKTKTIIDHLDQESDRNILIFTGQHKDYSMSKLFFQTLNVRDPDHCLNVQNVTQANMLSKCIPKITRILKMENPDCVLVQGDTLVTRRQRVLELFVSPHNGDRVYFLEKPMESSNQ